MRIPSNVQGRVQQPWWEMGNMWDLSWRTPISMIILSYFVSVIPWPTAPTSIGDGLSWERYLFSTCMICNPPTLPNLPWVSSRQLGTRFYLPVPHAVFACKVWSVLPRAACSCFCIYAAIPGSYGAVYYSAMYILVVSAWSAAAILVLGQLLTNDVTPVLSRSVAPLLVCTALLLVCLCSPDVFAQRVFWGGLPSYLWQPHLFLIYVTGDHHPL